MSVPEPAIVRGHKPEQSVHHAVVTEIQSVLVDAGVEFVLLEGFGLDVAVFIRRGTELRVRFIEIKAFVGSRVGGVGFGNNAGKGPQVDLLLHAPTQLQVVNSSIRWLLALGNRPMDSPRYAFFTSVRAQRAAMGEVSRGKQNNLRVSDFHEGLVTWDRLLLLLRQFLLE